MKYIEMMNYSYYNGICSDMEQGMFTNRGFDPEVRTDLVLYHENCADGSCSAGLHAAMKKAAAARKDTSSNTLYCSVRYGDEIETVKLISRTMSEYGIKKISELWVLDFHFEPGLMRDIYFRCSCPEKIIYLDHHKTAREDLENFRDWVSVKCPEHAIEAVFGSSSQAGAGMTYDYIVGRYGSEELAFGDANKKGYCHIKELVGTCVDYDLWTHKDPDTMAIITGIMSEPLPVREWADILLDYRPAKDVWLYRGLGIIGQQKSFAQSLISSDNIAELEYTGQKVAVLNIPHQWVNIVSDELLKNSDYAAVLSYSVAGRNEYVNVSMRAGRDRGIDCGEFMKEHFNGGGHLFAAGGRCSGILEFLEKTGPLKEKLSCEIE